MRSRIALLGTLVAVAAPTAVLTTAPAASAASDGTPCGTITARGVKVRVLVTYGTFSCRSARGLFRSYFRKAPVRPTSQKQTTITRGGRSFRCGAASTGRLDFICFPKTGSKPIVAADRR